MHRSILTCAFVLFGTVAFAQQQPADQSPQQQPAQADPYQGRSTPPADDIITTAPDQPQPKAKPKAGKPIAQPAAPSPNTATQPAADQMPGQNPAQGQGSASAQFAAHPSSVDPSVNYPDPAVTGTDDGIVGIAKQEPQDAPAPQPMLRSREESSDPDGDIVHPHPLAPGELPDGTTIRVRLLTRLSTVDSQPGEVFRTRVATDVLQDGQVLIPAG